MSFPHKPKGKKAIPKTISLDYMKKVRLGFYAMNKKSVSTRSLYRNLTEPDVYSTNPKIEIEIEQYKAPGENLFEFTLLDDTVMSYRDDFDMRNFLYEYEAAKFDLQKRGILSEMDKDLIRNVDNED